MTDRSHLKRAFAFRLGYVALFWLICVLTAPAEPDTGFGHLLVVLAWGLPFALPLLAWADWRWLSSHPEAVNRWGLRARR